jgi:T4 superinfection immunity protein
VLIVLLDSFGGGYAIGRVIGFFIGLALYFVPTIIAFNRRSQHRVAILLVNLLLGWTLVGWIAMLVWAIVDRSENSTPTMSTQQRAS